MEVINISLAFLEGVALIVSPCILPVLPLMLSASLDGGRARPFGIIAGFAVAFSAFVLLSRQIIGALHIEPDIIRTVSLVLLGLFGLILLSGRLSTLFSALTQRAANLGNQLAATRRGGFIGGVVIGGLIGLVWTPCAGPILATVLVQVIREKTDLQGALTTFSFAIGASLPMLLIALTGRRVIGKLRFLNHHTEALRRIFGILILASVAFMGLNNQTTAMPTTIAQAISAPEATALQDGLAAPYPAPEFRGLGTWLNSPPLKIDDLKGKVVLVDFWTYSCINCVRTLPYITAWDRQYRDKGLVIIGVHAPEFEFEKSIDNVRAAIARHGISYPVALDNSLATWLSFDNHYWPAHYLIDREGRVVYTHFGEGKYDVTENNIRYLLGLKGTGDDTRIVNSHSSAGEQTPETYLGIARAQRYDGGVGLQRNVVADYRSVSDVAQDHWTLDGAWKVEDEKIISQKDGAFLQIHFKAKKVFLVMGTVDGAPQTVALRLNGAVLAAKAGKDVRSTDSTLTVAGHTLYELVNQPDSQDATLTLTAQQAGVELYAFTFGN